MEHVKGVPITTHADRQRLSIDERLDLFLQVCGAVHHAHQKGLIHRDLKPSNILVSYDQDQSVAKVIDFGVAKAINQSAVEARMFTQHGQLIGTPEYMSPEQAEASAQDIDTRADVYSLGVVLYELLAGTLPFDPSTLRSAALHEIHRVIREVDPPKPSTNVSSAAEKAAATAEGISKARRSDPRSLSRRLRGDLDWIVMKCLEKDRHHRYDSASSLAEDLRRYMKNEPVSAGPPSAAYKARKFVRRHRAGVAAAGLVVVALAFGLTMTTWQWFRAEAARSAAAASDARARGIANSLINRFHDGVVPLPGSASVRDGFVRDATALLEDMASNGRPEILLDAADGFDRVAQVQAGLRTAHRGDLTGAIATIDRARALRDQAARDPAAPADRVAIGLAGSALLRGDVMREQERTADAIAAYREGLAMLDGLTGADAATEAAHRQRALLRVALANALFRAGDPANERPALLTSSVEVLRPITAASPTRENRWALARAHTNLGEHVLLVERNPEASLASFGAAAELWNAILRDMPVDSIARHDLAGTEYHRATALGMLTRQDEADAAWGESARHYGFLLEADPTDRRAALGLGRVLEGRANALRKSDPDRAITEFSRAIDVLQRGTASQPNDAAALRVLGACQYLLARTVIEKPEPDVVRAASAAASAFATLDALDRIAPGDEAFTRRRIADSAQVWLVALDRAGGAVLGQADRARAAEGLERVVARWSAEPPAGQADTRAESKALARVVELAKQAKDGGG
jgi:tetratricopeptide (TPR) repeat protein